MPRGVGSGAFEVVVTQQIDSLSVMASI